MTLTGVIVTERRAGTVAAPAVWEAEVARLTPVTLPADDVRLAGALTAERLTLEALGALAVTLALQGAVVVVGGQREDSVTAETWRVGGKEVRIHRSAGSEDKLVLLE